MPSSIKNYRNEEKKRNYLARNRKRYYSRNMDNCTSNYKTWTALEDEMVLQQEYTDYQLSQIICRSIAAIQKRRYVLKRGRK